ncbi:hypothetical protein RvY_15871 [Ramazzottius varieornatus]|uniref:Ninjurin-1 n=1 Tax=Ramazzottius varieornatus TaxID=947166 RepID=A0A1D1VXW4_RAMVA|nr:hypothetical protein RvY_15871 [Ramazzottius varieornatus]
MGDSTMFYTPVLGDEDVVDGKPEVVITVTTPPLTLDFTKAGNLHDDGISLEPLRRRAQTWTKGDRTGDDVRDSIALERTARLRKVSLTDVLDAKSEIPDLRTGRYNAKKNIVQGLLDIALLTANASQLKNLVETENHPFFTPVFALLLISIAVQVAVAVLMLVVARLEWDEDLDSDKQQKKRNYRAAIVLNDISTVGVFVITIVNIFIASFISHGKAYVPTTDPKARWDERVLQQKTWLSASSRGATNWTVGSP